MRILFLTQIIPYPPDAGPKVKTWHVLRYLADRGHEIVLASFVRPEEETYVANLKQVSNQIHTIPMRRSRIKDAGYWLRSQLTGRPFLVERDDLEAMRSLVSWLLETESIDCIHADQLTMAQFALDRKSGLAPNRESEDGRSRNSTARHDRDHPLLIFDAHNAVWTIDERMSETLPRYLRPVMKLEAKRTKLYEGMIVDTYDYTLTVSEIDRRYLVDANSAYRIRMSKGVKSSSPSQQLDENRLPVIPIAVDTDLLQPINRRPYSMMIFTLGTLHYPPNVDGIRWFANEVFPIIQQKVPAARLTIIGKNPPKDIKQLELVNPEAFRVTGYVEDLRPLLEESSLVVVPVRTGSGMRVRILEAFAQAMPVVTTTIGLEGIKAEPGKDVLVADTPEDFAIAVIKILQDRSLQNQLSENGRRLAKQLYDWKVALKKIDQIYGGDG